MALQIIVIDLLNIFKEKGGGNLVIRESTRRRNRIPSPNDSLCAI